jgi:hypothetical protein
MIPTLQLGQMGLARRAPAGAPATYLDGLATTPRAVLSLRKLISTATNSIRVRRSSDNTEQDIGFVGNSLDTASLASFVGAGNGFVVTFYDQTGNGEHATQATAANQPRIVNAGVYDGRLIFDGTNDSLSISSLTMGAAQAAFYAKMQLPTATGVHILFEQSANYNSNAQSCVAYLDTSTSGKLNMSSRNTTGAADYRLQHFPSTASTFLQFSLLYNRALTGTAEEAAYQSGVALTPSTTAGTADQTGVYSSYDLYIGARAGTSLFAALQLETLVVYNADSSAIRTSIEALVA